VVRRGNGKVEAGVRGGCMKGGGECREKGGGEEEWRREGWKRRSGKLGEGKGDEKKGRRE